MRGFVIGVFCGILFKKEVYKNQITIEFRKGEIIWKKIKRIKKRMKN